MYKSAMSVKGSRMAFRPLKIIPARQSPRNLSEHQRCGIFVHNHTANEPFYNLKLSSCPFKFALVANAVDINAAIPSDEGGEDTSAKFAVRLVEIITFAAPVILVPLADPLMSLIDTVSLGKMADAVQVAALGACSLIFNTANYALAALGVSTVTLSAERLALGQPRRASHVVTAALLTAALCGVTLSAYIYMNGPQLLAATGANEIVRGPALTYLRIRAFALPAALMVQVLQSSLLSQRDSKTPFRIVLTTSLCSLLGDLLFIGHLGMGVAGAATTTVAAQWLQAFLAFRAVSASQTPPCFTEVPSKEDLLSLARTFAVLGLFYVAKNLSHLAIQATAAKLPPTDLAGHQSIFSVWTIASFLNSPMEQAALAFVPTAKNLLDRYVTCLVVMAMGMTNWVTACVWAIMIPATWPNMLISDAAAWPIIRHIAPMGAIALLFTCIDVSLTGLLLASKDRTYVAVSMVLSGVGLMAFLGWAGTVMSRLDVVWWGLTVFFGLRTFFSASRVFQKKLLHKPC